MKPTRNEAGPVVGKRFVCEIIARGTDGRVWRLDDFDQDRDWAHKSDGVELVRVCVGFLPDGKGSVPCSGMGAAVAPSGGQNSKGKGAGSQSHFHTGPGQSEVQLSGLSARSSGVEAVRKNLIVVRLTGEGRGAPWGGHCAKGKSMKPNLAVEQFLASRRVVIVKFVTHRHKAVQSKS